MSISLYRPLLIELAVLLVCTLTVCQNDIPEFLVEPSSQIVSEDSNITLSCSVKPSSAVLRWRFEGEDLEENNFYGFKVLNTELRISSAVLLERQESVFQCVAETSTGSILSKPATIYKAVLRKFEDRSDLNLTASQGSNLVLPCQPPYSRPPAKVTFRFNQTTTIDKDTDHYKLLPSGNLQILKVSRAHAGQYQCMAENELRDRIRHARYSINLHVVDTDVPNQEPAVIMPTAELKAAVGDNVVLECSAVGNPQPVITWEKYGGKLVPGRYTQKYGNLYLHNVTREDEGTYLCKADNGLNTLMLDGLKAMMLEISEPPTVRAVEQTINVTLGGRRKLACSITGRPKPQVTWYHNGHLLKSYTESRMFISNTEARHQGLYQCFAENTAGIAHSEIRVNVDVTKRDTSYLTQSDQNVTDSPSKSTNNETSAGQKSKRRHSRKNRKRHRNDRKKAHLIKSAAPKLVPPSKPDVRQLSDTAVMLNWTVPDNEGLKITFFRVQFKKVGPKKGKWETEDVEIGQDVRTFEVGGLRPRATYKFRIAAVYSNNDNAHGPNSDKFEIKLHPEPNPEPPANKPIIVEVIPIDFQNIHALNVRWQHNTENLLSPSPIEGFYIYYRPFHSTEPFQNVTLLQPSVRTHLLTNLLPGTEYLIKMQSFNEAGNSPYSTEVAMRTKGDSPVPDTPRPPDVKITTSKPLVKPDPQDNEDNVHTSRSGSQSNSETLYMILGIVLGVMMLLLIVFMFMCWWKQRQQRRMMDAMNDAVRNKLQDSSQRLYTDSLRKKMTNGGVSGMNGVNGTMANGHIPRNFHKMNINVNPMSDMETLSHTPDSSNHYTSTFHPNGTLPLNHRTSDNNCNNINQSKSLQNSLQHLNHHNNQSVGEAVTLGGGESLASPPSPSMCNSVPVGHNSDAHERRSLSSRSCDHGSCDPGDSSYDDTGGVHSNRHRKRRRRNHCKEQTTKDQATNTDLSSNDGTMDLSENKAVSSSQESGHMLNASTPPPSVLTNYDSSMLVPCPNAV